MEYGCIGEHLPHSFSKEIHERIGDYRYELRELTPDALGGFLEKKSFRAINVTIPYKQAVIEYLDHVDETAARIGAVNTIVNRNGRLYGYNTDIIGLTNLIQRTGVDLSGKKVLVLGTGGTSKTAVCAASRLGAAEVNRVSRSGKDGAITYAEAYAAFSDADVIVNTTPCGMFPAPFDAPVDVGRFPRLAAVIDAVYNPLRTRLVLAAEEKGIPAEGGLYMLVSQAVAAYGIFMDRRTEEESAERIFRAVRREKENLVLIGMPGCGKSTVGKLLAQRTGKTFVDTDELIVQREQKTVSAIFAQQGEGYFRDVERDVIRDLAQRSGLVIATGGGAVLRKENTEALKMNGRILFLDRSLPLLLPTDDRPLALDRAALEQRYRERYGIYLSAADARIPNDVSPEDAVRMIGRRDGYEDLDPERAESEYARDPGAGDLREGDL